MEYINNDDGREQDLYVFMGVLDGMKWATGWSAVELRPAALHRSALFLLSMLLDIRRNSQSHFIL
jgi:hypothetical protein